MPWDAWTGRSGGLDVVVANAGIINAVRPSWELDEAPDRTPERTERGVRSV